MNRYQTFCLVLFMFFLVFAGRTQETGEPSEAPVLINETLQWRPVENIMVAPGRWMQLLSFTGSGIADEFRNLPVYFY